MGKGKSVNITQFAPHRDTMGKTGNQDIAAIQPVGNVVGSRLTFHSWIGRKDQLRYPFFVNTLQQPLNTDLLGAHTVDG